MVGLVAKVGCMASRTECGTPVRPVIDWLPALMKCGVVALSARRSMASRLPHFPRCGPHSARGARAWLGDPEIDGAVVVVAAAERGGQGDPLSLAVLVEFDNADWKRREWIRVYEDPFAAFLVEETLTWHVRNSDESPSPALWEGNGLLDSTNARGKPVTPCSQFGGEQVSVAAASRYDVGLCTPYVTSPTRKGATWRYTIEKKAEQRESAVDAACPGNLCCGIPAVVRIHRRSCDDHLVL
ncbi:hypothetical protein HPB49_001623 [Dermacentor silvarum]|uniref:Uncharacterized protein n=1 Tax=Dermacentor silvarum TaxID=543639 RepID=A0ACB8DT49_DERSI|nr:hypothetical protein HPB49_001623 [Dermacentor silvarum]